jgi:hypothetical protein
MIAFSDAVFMLQIVILDAFSTMGNLHDFRRIQILEELNFSCLWVFFSEFYTDGKYFN